MAHPYHHSLSSAKKWGGCAEDYQHIHDWFDASKAIIADFRHRALRHHAEGIFMAETIFGHTLTLSTRRVIPTRWVGEQHVREDLGFIPSFADWVKAIRPEPWMGRAQKLEDIVTVDPEMKRHVGTSWQIPPALLRLKISTTGGVKATSKPQGMGGAA
jgi:hypothetical protein